MSAPALTYIDELEFIGVQLDELEYRDAETHRKRRALQARREELTRLIEEDQ